MSDKHHQAGLLLTKYQRGDHLTTPEMVLLERICRETARFLAASGEGLATRTLFRTAHDLAGYVEHRKR